MTKQKLIQYLNAASDAEAAVYYYEESIGLLRQKLSMLEPVQRPADAVKPKPLERKGPFSKYFAGFWIAGIADVVVIVGFLKSMSNDNWGYPRKSIFQNRTQKVKFQQAIQHNL